MARFLLFGRTDYAFEFFGSLDENGVTFLDDAMHEVGPFVKEFRPAQGFLNFAAHLPKCLAKPAFERILPLAVDAMTPQSGLLGPSVQVLSRACECFSIDDLDRMLSGSFFDATMLLTCPENLHMLADSAVSEHLCGMVDRLATERAFAVRQHQRFAILMGICRHAVGKEFGDNSSRPFCT